MVLVELADLLLGVVKSVLDSHVQLIHGCIRLAADLIHAPTKSVFCCRQSLFQRDDLLYHRFLGLCFEIRKTCSRVCAHLIHALSEILLRRCHILFQRHNLLYHGVFRLLFELCETFSHRLLRAVHFSFHSLFDRIHVHRAAPGRCVDFLLNHRDVLPQRRSGICNRCHSVISEGLKKPRLLLARCGYGRCQSQGHSINGFVDVFNRG